MATKAQQEAENLRKLAQERRDIQFQINEGLKNQNNLTNQYATLLQAQFNKTKQVNDNLKDRVGVLNALAKGSDKSLTVESRIESLQSKQAEVQKKMNKMKTKSGSLDKRFKVVKDGSLVTDKEILDTEISRLQIQKSVNDGLTEADKLTGNLGQSIIEFVKNPLAAAVAILLTFNATQESIGKQFGAIGVKEFRRDLAGANAQFTQIGLGADEAQSTISNLANEFGISVSESAKLSENVSRLAVSTGASLDDTTKLIGVFTQTQNLTGEQAANLLASTTALANANNVAPDKILGDVAQNTEFFAQFADEGGENILRAAVQARKLGINLQSVEKITSGLLDFQSSLNAENEASVLIGRRLNFQKARELALSNDVEGATRAVVEQLGSAEEFNRLNAIQRKALADAAGVEVGELAKIVNKEKEALTLAGALSKQQIQPIPEEVLTQTAQLIGSLQSIGITLAETVGPPLNLIVSAFAFLAEGLNIVNGFIQDNIELSTGLAVVIGGLIALKKKEAIVDFGKASASAVKKAFEGGPKGPLGIGLSIAAALAGVALIGRLKASTMDDGIIGPEGKTIVSGPKGTNVLNPEDSMIVGTNLFGGTGGGGQASNVEQARAMAKQSETLNRILTTLDGAFGDGGRGLSKMLAAGVVSGNEQSA